ncbi:LPXTG cell wall anchor domain-containing protein [Streptomyces sp. ISL-96]|uniref:LPXTG cell wall anchor domain-containing protein n=1 Tax=Streptomyces sp. ISL-96 TaxID=2819191 RepID=UPI001BE7BB63|nr:LPXTG cell wall anchor domain-containing protein [Streptomyces sp. ISL-96]MBT2491789.1 LPXTG cell wall anchor domain-containing protein [Streptomyces sp. ISL-96]
MRPLITSSALVTAVTASLLLAPSAYATPKGDNGTVKIHDATTGEELRKNEPKVCSFYLDAFGFDAAQQVDWHIEAWANNELAKGETVKSGSLTLDSSGHERTADMTLPDGQYKLFWNFEGENGRAKHKVFKTDCPAEENPADKPGKPADKPADEPAEEPGATPNEKPSEPAPAGEQPNGGASPAESAPASPAPAGQGDVSGGSGDLAETGSGAPVGVLSAVAAALLGAGGYLVMRRRKAQQS